MPELLAVITREEQEVTPQALHEALAKLRAKGRLEPPWHMVLNPWTGETEVFAGPAPDA